MIGIEVEVFGEIFDISTNLVHLSSPTIDVWPKDTVVRLPEHSHIFISHDGESFHEELLQYSSGDGVCLTTRLTNVELKFMENSSYPYGYAYYTYYYFDLLAIRKVNTLSERKTVLEAQQQKELDNRHQKQLAQTLKNKQPEGGAGTGCFVATAAFRDYDAPEVLCFGSIAMSH